MTQAIRHRRPTEADANIQNHVLVFNPVRGEWESIHFEGVSLGDWWRPIDQTPPPDEKPKRRVWYTQVNKRGELQGKASPRMDFENVKAIEVRPGDPDDLDALLAAIDSRERTDLIGWSENVLRARHGEGGDE